MKLKNLADEMFPELTEQEIEELVSNVPPKDRRLVTSAVDYSISTLVDYLRQSTLNIPEFQRNYVWSQSKASRLIESLIMQCPIPVIYLGRRPDDTLDVIDGNQRLTSIRRFVDGHYALKGLTAFPELEGSYHDTLDPRFQRHIQNKTIRCVIIEPESHPQIKFDVFERLNSGSTPLNPQELRHGIYSGRLFTLIDVLASGKDFVRLTGVKNNTRMKRDELALRLLALSEGFENYEKPLSNFLNTYCEQHRHISEQEARKATREFQRLLERIEATLGGAPFRMSMDDHAVPKFNTAYFDAIATGFARSNIMALTVDEAREAANAVEAAITQLRTDDAFRSATLRATSDEPSVKTRIRKVTNAVNAAI